MSDATRTFVDPSELASSIYSKCLVDRCLALFEMTPAELSEYSRQQRNYIISAVLGEDPLAAELVKESGRVPQCEVDDANAELALVLCARGEPPSGEFEAVVTENSGAVMLAMVAAAARSDWGRLRSICEQLPREYHNRPEVMLLLGCALSQTGDRWGGEKMISMAVAKVVDEQDLDRPDFWALVNYIPGHYVETRAWLVSALGWHVLARGTPSVAFDMIENLANELIADEDGRRIVHPFLARFLRALLAKGAEFAPRRLAAVAEMLAKLSEAVRDWQNTTDAHQVQAQCAFASGRTSDGVARQRRGAEFSSLGHRIHRIWSARVLDHVDVELAPSVERFERLGKPFQWFTAMPRVEGRPLASPYKPSQSWVAEFRGAEVLTGHVGGSVFHYVLTQDGDAVLDGLNIHPSFHVGSVYSAFRAFSPTGDVLIDLSKVPDPVHVSHPCMLIGGVPNYYHWLMEYLPKVGLWRDSRLGDDKHLKFLVNQDAAPWQFETLETLGVERHRIVYINGHVPTKCGRLIVPTISGPDYAVGFLRSNFLPIELPVHCDKIVYVSRIDAGQSRRRIDNELEVLSAMRNIEARILVPSETTVSEQVRAFAGAKVVVGAHGAGLTNIAFCSRQCRVIEINNSINLKYNFFDELANAVGLRLDHFLGSQPSGTSELEDAPVIVDTEALMLQIGSACRDWEL